MRILLTGGTGTISSAIAEEAVKRGYETYCMTRGNRTSRNVPGACYLSADVGNPEQVAQVLGDLHFDVLVECIVYNVEQLKNSLRMFENRYEQYIFISSCAVHEQENNKNDDELLGNSRYAKNKSACEEYLSQYFDKHNQKKYTVVRPPFVYGRYHMRFSVDTNFDQWVVLERVGCGMPVLCCKNVKVPMEHSSDFAKAAVCLFENENAYGMRVDIVEKGNEVSWDEIYKEASRVLGTDARVVHLPLFIYRMFFPKDRYEAIKYQRCSDMILDDSVLKKLVPDFTQETDIRKGFSEVIPLIKEEYVDESVPRDEAFNQRTDAALIYAYNRQLIPPDELEDVEKYFDEYFSLNANRKNIDIAGKLKAFYDLLVMWMELKQSGKNIDAFLKSNGYDSVAIYGMRELGILLYRELKTVKVICAFDRAIDHLEDLPELKVVQPDSMDQVSGTNAVIVTAVCDYSNIFLDNRKKINVPFLSLNDIILEMKIGSE